MTIANAITYIYMIAKRNRYSVKEFKLMFICSHMPRCNMGSQVRQCINWQADSVPYMVLYIMLKFTKHITMSSSKLLKCMAYDGISETLPN